MSARFLDLVFANRSGWGIALGSASYLLIQWIIPFPQPSLSSKLMYRAPSPGPGSSGISLAKFCGTFYAHCLILSFSVPMEYKGSYNTQLVFYENSVITQGMMHYFVTSQSTTTHQCFALFVLRVALIQEDAGHR